MLSWKGRVYIIVRAEIKDDGEAMTSFGFRDRSGRPGKLSQARHEGIIDAVARATVVLANTMRAIVEDSPDKDRAHAAVTDSIRMYKDRPELRVETGDV
jgi:hypothetical protein